MAKKVLVTGCSGYLGSVLVNALLDHPLVAKVVGLDLTAPKVSHPKFKHYAADIRDEFLLRSILGEEGIDVVYHLAFMMGEPRDEVIAREINVGGTLTVLEACSKTAGVSKLILSASASAYGARRGNPEFLKEEDPLRANTLRYGIHKRLVEEELAKSLPGARASLKVVVLRICTIVGTTERSDGPVKTFCELPAIVSVLFHKGGLQFITEADLMRVMLKSMEVSDFRGTYNVGSDDYTTLAELGARLGKPRVPVPYFLLWLGLFFFRRLNGKTQATEKVVSYLAYPVVVSNAKIKKALGITFTKGSLEAFLECARTLTAAPAATTTAEKSLV
jgi:UDP-glucose 4-epimerase